MPCRFESKVPMKTPSNVYVSFVLISGDLTLWDEQNFGSKDLSLQNCVEGYGTRRVDTRMENGFVATSHTTRSGRVHRPSRYWVCGDQVPVLKSAEATVRSSDSEVIMTTHAQGHYCCVISFCPSFPLDPLECRKVSRAERSRMILAARDIRTVGDKYVSSWAVPW